MEIRLAQFTDLEDILKIKAIAYNFMLSKDNNALESTAKTIDEDDIPTTRILDQYSLEFLDLPNNYSEKDLALVLFTI